MRTVIVMQVRNASTRLPGKAMLPVAGFPSSLLAALRAANQGHEIRVATSSEPSDADLAELFCSRGIRVVRGSLDDVLGRFVQATEDLPEDCLIVRITADNILPDGTFVGRLTSRFSAYNADYLSYSFPQSHVPYGLGAEAFSVGTLRKAHRFASTLYDREHVGPWIAHNCQCVALVPEELRSLDLSHLRCTIDDEEDYERICVLFRGVTDPVHIGWFELARRLAQLPKAPSFAVRYKILRGQLKSEFTLGTAQLGMHYGIANRAGKPSRSAAIEMVRHAILHRVTSIDTARGYGDAEEVLKDALSGAWRSRVEVATKLDPLASLPYNAPPDVIRAAVDESVQRSCEALGVRQLSILLLHRWEHRHLCGGTIWNRLLELRDEGRIGVLGASVYEPSEALAALEDPSLRHLQIPMNVLDWRWKAAGIDAALASRPDVEVYARSALLQGLLAGEAEWWPVSSSYDADTCAHRLKAFAQRFGRANIKDLCFAYLRSQAWITSVVVGCETLEQLEENLKLFCTDHLTEEQCAEIEASLPVAPEELLNPSKWKLAHEQSSK